MNSAAVRIFHENYLIFWLPAAAAAAYVFPGLPDFRVVLTFLGGALYFPAVAFSIARRVEERRVEEAYHRLFHSEVRPSLPEEHYFDLKTEKEEAAA